MSIHPTLWILLSTLILVDVNTKINCQHNETNCQHKNQLSMHWGKQSTENAKCQIPVMSNNNYQHNNQLTSQYTIGQLRRPRVITIYQLSIQ